MTAMIRPGITMAPQTSADKRDGDDEIGGYLGSPKPFLVPGEEVTGQRKSEHELQEDQAEPEIDLARRFVRTVNDHLHQMKDQKHGHGLGRVMMQSAQEPAASHLILDVINALPGSLRAGAIGHPEENAGDELDGERE